MTDLVAPSASDLTLTDDPEAMVLTLCDQGRTALTQAQDVATANAVLGKVRIMEHATRLVKMAGDAAVAASSLRVDGERRVGQLMRAEREAGTMAKQAQGRPKKTLGATEGLSESTPPTLADAGIRFDQAAAYSQLAELDDEVYRQSVDEAEAEAKERGANSISRAQVLAKAREKSAKAEQDRADMQAIADHIEVARPDLAARMIYHAATTALSKARKALTPIDPATAATGADRTVVTEYVDLDLEQVDFLIGWLSTYRRRLSPMTVIKGGRKK